MTDNIDTFINFCEKDNYKLSSNYFPNINNLNREDNLNCFNIINFLFSFYPYKDISYVYECCQEIINLYEKMKTSKYNSAIQKYFIQLKEIKDELIYEQPDEFSEKENNSSLFSNFIENKNQEQVDKLDDNINMIIVN